MFKKYPSLTNHYMGKDIERFKEIYWDKLKDTNWIVQEKLHGANMSFLFQPRTETKIFSRNQEVDETFYSAGEVFRSTIEQMLKIQEWTNKTGRMIRVFGELFGANVQKGVNYGPNKMVRFYDIQQNDQQRSVRDFENFFFDLGFGNLCVPKYGIFPTLEDAMECSIERNTHFSKFKDQEEVEEGYLIEGVTIKPFEEVFEDRNGSLFYIKHKNEKFKESQRVKKVRTETQYSEEVNKWRDIFLSYIHPERCESVFSKEGRIESIRELGKYISLIHKDAMETFKKEEDYPEETFTKQEKKYIMNSSKTIVDLLKANL